MSCAADRLMPAIEDIYAAAASFDRWPAALTRIADTLGAEDASLGAIAPHGTPWIFAPRTDPAFMASYPQYHAGNAVLHAITTRGVGAAVTDEMVMPRRERIRSGYYNEWSRPQGYKNKLGGAVLQEGGWQTMLTLPGRRPFAADAVRAFQALSPHVARAVQINIQLAQGSLDSEVTARLLREMDSAALVVDADGRLLFANAAAEGLFKPGEGLSLEQGILRARQPLAAALLGRLIGACARGGVDDAGGSFSIKCAAGGAVATMTRHFQVTPMRGMARAAATSAGLPALLAPGVPAALIIERKPAARRSLSALQLSNRYGLTPAEARFAVEIARGDGKHAAAARCGITYATARSHLSRVFDKTGVRRQAELARLVMGA